MNIHKPLLFWCSPLVQSLTHRQSRHNLKSPANHRVILGRTLRDPGGLHGTFMFFSPTPLRHTNDDRVQRRLFLDYGTRKTCTQSAAVRRLKPKNKNNGSSFAYTKCVPFKMQARREQDGKHSIGTGKPKRTVC